jgi:hypothetical protein
MTPPSPALPTSCTSTESSPWVRFRLSAASAEMFAKPVSADKSKRGSRVSKRKAPGRASATRSACARPSSLERNQLASRLSGIPGWLRWSLRSWLELCSADWRSTAAKRLDMISPFRSVGGRERPVRTFVVLDLTPGRDLAQACVGIHTRRRGLGRERSLPERRTLKLPLRHAPDGGVPCTQSRLAAARDSCAGIRETRQGAHRPLFPYAPANRNSTGRSPFSGFSAEQPYQKHGIDSKRETENPRAA